MSVDLPDNRSTPARVGQVAASVRRFLDAPKVFTRLRTKLTVLYVALFGAVLMIVSLSVFAAINQVAQRQVRAELTATGTVFDRVWSLRSDRLREGASLLSKDFGFREAVATHDGATIVSALENLKQRFNIDRAFIVATDGQLIGEDTQSLAGDGLRLTKAFDNAVEPTGVVMLGGQPYQVVGAAVMSPDQIGWLVFAVKLDRTEMSALEKLSAIPLSAKVMHRDGKAWSMAGGAGGSEAGKLSAFVDHELSKHMTTAEPLSELGGKSLALVKPLPSLTKTAPAVQVLR